ncbi:hypothetical protein ETAA8_32350 [Anatilimnocola aggregata]|uniref:Uncharacterized protein n=1 Tax=Anatilimnocola aggregata TaxID=2528021 RepID=A0A517YD17_9BACT|nr:hypothetical protein [Anatilimnocola aggregata]QDU28135.1 hypothetical protein ETAA8_32350 [Anatilimnocola aggregata]
MPALYPPSVSLPGASLAANSGTAISLLAATGPGNMAPHFRVQTREAASQQPWKLVASFSDLSLAQICLERLRRSGAPARLIAYRRVPTAA